MQTLENGFHCDIEKLLRPVSLDDPTGENIRYDPVYDRIREARREDDATLPQGVWKTEQKQADWAAVAGLCLDVLETRSKDLQIAAWLLEAWLHMHGFAGMAAGFALIHALCERYWDELHPRIEGHDLEFRVAPLTWINRKLPVQIKLCSITAPQSNDVAAFTWADWEIVCQTDSAAPKARAGADPKRGPTIAAFHQSVRLTSTSYFHQLLVDIEQLLTECQTLESLLDEKLQKESPGLVAVRSAAEAIAGLLTSILRERGANQISGELVNLAASLDESADSADQACVSSLIRTREDAYRLLADIANFLEQTEPHSPTPYLIRRAVSWGSLPLAKLLPELVRNPSELSEVFRLLNI